MWNKRVSEGHSSLISNKWWYTNDINNEFPSEEGFSSVLIFLREHVDTVWEWRIIATLFAIRDILYRRLSNKVSLHSWEYTCIHARIGTGWTVCKYTWNEMNTTRQSI